MGRGERRSSASTAVAAPMPRLRDLPKQELPDISPDQEWFQPDPAIIAEAKQIARELDCDEIIAMRLVMLGKDAQQITDYLNPSPQHIRHPDQTVSGMSDAAAALRQGIARGEGVALFSDYDVDGQTSRAILTEALNQEGANIFAGSANAETGFGLTRDFVEEAHKNGAQWLVTVDCGSTQSDPVRLAQRLGMQVIVLDHHDVDLKNPADYHLNPRLRAAAAMEELIAAGDRAGIRQSLVAGPPWVSQLDKLSDLSRQKLIDDLGQEQFDQLEATIRADSDPNNTGSMLTWKFAAAMQLDQDDQVSPNHYGRALYLAGLGAIADLAPTDDQEVRAFVRVATDEEKQKQFFGNRDVVPPGIKLLAESFDEDPLRPDEMTRTRALLNLSKRSSEVSPDDIQKLLAAEEADKKTRTLAERMAKKYDKLSSIRRDKMDPQVIEQLDDQDGGRFAFATLTGFEKYAGYSRMCANTAVKESGRPALVFVRKTESDEFGQELYKFSGANGVVPDAELGDLINDRRMRRACKVKARDWLGDKTELVNLGGHAAVVSGVCTRDNIEEVQAAAEAWAKRQERSRSWNPVQHKRPRIAKRLVSPSRLRRLEREAEMLSPFSFPESPTIQVSAKGKFSQLATVDHGYEATFTLEDGSDRRVQLAPDVAAAVRDNRRQQFEAILPLGRSGKYYISQLVS